MIISYVHASILPMLRIIGSCILSCIAFCLKHVFLLQVLILIVVIDLTFPVMFLSVFKIQKLIKIEKSSKSLITCFECITCEFGLIPSY